MATVPVATPVTTPMPVPTVAILLLLQLHVPPVVASVSNVDCPMQAVQPVTGHAMSDGPTFITLTVPVIEVVHPAVFVPVAVYVPAAVSVPKLIAAPVPDIDVPTGKPLQNSL